MNKRMKVVVGAAAVAAVIGVGTGVGVAASRGDDVPLQGSDYDRATAAALAHVGQGTVVETEIGDDGGAYAVEVRLDDGSQVEVVLDANFEVIDNARDDDRANDRDAGGADD